MIDLKEKEIVPILKREHLIELVQDYSDYVIDIGGLSIEQYAHKNYLKDKSPEQIIIESEINDDFISLSDRIYNLYCDNCGKLEEDDFNNIIQEYEKNNK